MKRSTRLQSLAAALLALGGGIAIVYAGSRPIPPFSDVPVPLVWLVIGIVGLAAGLGVFLGQAWGRALGVGIIAVDLAFLVFQLITQAPESSPLQLGVSVVIDAVVLWVLLARWSGVPDSAGGKVA